MEAILIHERTYEFSACKLDVFGLKITGFTDVSYGDSLEIGEGRGASQVPLATSKGKYKAEAFKASIHRSTGQELRAHIAGQSQDGKSLGGVRGTIVLQYVDDLLGVQTITAKGCRVTKPGDGASKEGSDPDMEAWEFYVKTLDRNGITLFESGEPGA